MCFHGESAQLLQRDTRKPHVSHVMLWLTLLQLLLQQPQQQVGVQAASGVPSGSTRTRAAKVAIIHGLQVAAESLPPRAAPAKEAANRTAAQTVAGRYEIHAVSGEPNYKSVNLTWEVEFVPSEERGGPTFQARTTHSTVTNGSAEVEPPKAFQVFFCELQSFGPHRCRSKLLDERLQQVEEVGADADAAEGDPLAHNRQLRRYAAHIDNLRMATRYSFHIRPQQQHRSAKVSARAEVFDNEVEEEKGSPSVGQTIVIPTKGFSAQATKCLPHASEIEVQTGPFFGGKIVVDGGLCGIKGNPQDPADTYTMRIDHKLCGSLVKPETNTVETFITVQENLGIFTHSTRRFVVVCSFQSGMQTVRASFTVPGKEGVAAAVESDPFEPDARVGREHRQMRYVDKSALVLRERNEAAESADSEDAVVQEVQNPAALTAENLVDGGDEDDRTDAVAQVEDVVPGVNEERIKHESVEREERESVEQEVLEGQREAKAEAEENEATVDPVPAEEPAAHARLAKFAQLVVEQREPRQSGSGEWLETAFGRGAEADSSALQQLAGNFGSVVLTVSLSVVMIGVFVCVVLRETRRPTLLSADRGHHENRKQQQQQQQKTAPQQQQQQQEQRQHQQRQRQSDI